MENYPEGWKWTNGIQQERARMILPLAWLVQVQDTPEHMGMARSGSKSFVGKSTNIRSDQGRIR